MKAIALALWARHPRIEIAVRDLLRPLASISLVKKASPAAPPAMPDCPTFPNPIQIIVLARDPFTEAFLRELLHAVPRLTCVCKQQSHPDAVLMEHPLLTLCEQRGWEPVWCMTACRRLRMTCAGPKRRLRST
jgi:hypothetical protein